MGAVHFHIDAAVLDAREVLEEAEQVWRTRCDNEGVHFSVDELTEPVLVRADAMRIRQIIDNLMENALRVSPQGSAIHLALHTDPDIAGGSFGVFEVRDSGPGLSADDIAVAFEPGALHERYRGVRPVGTGLGLALVARLASNMGGSATVTSKTGEGTSFWVRIPLVEQT
jgi:two-component system OmpR family sensor kinase